MALATNLRASRMRWRPAWPVQALPRILEAEARSEFDLIVPRPDATGAPSRNLGPAFCHKPLLWYTVRCAILPGRRSFAPTVVSPSPTIREPLFPSGERLEVEKVPYGLYNTARRLQLVEQQSAWFIGNGRNYTRQEPDLTRSRSQLTHT